MQQQQQQSLYSLPSVQKLISHYNELKSKHMRDLLSDASRNSHLKIQTDTLLFDYSHQKITLETLQHLSSLAAETQLITQFTNMFNGDITNTCERRSVLHTALRLPKTESLIVNGVDVVKSVHEVLEKIKTYSTKIRNGDIKGFSGKRLTKIIAIGIGGSYLGTDFVYNALKSHKKYNTLSEGFELKFIANVCPVDFYNAVKNLNVEETLVIVVSKTFTTAETMLNSRNMKQWVIEAYKKINPQLTANDIDNIISHHFCAVSSNIPKTEAFGIDKENVFGFWDWVGGRYSVWSAVGALPLSICFSYETFEEFLTGGKAIDDSIRRCDNDNVINNIPIMLGLIGFYNTFIRNINTRAVLPYSQALSKFPSHIQQLDMESNGKKVSKFTNEFLEHECGPVVFGEAGTNGQHSFYQLIHQGRELTCEFIAHCTPQFDCHYEGEKVSSHVELMSNFFAQPDALAYGKYTQDELKDVPQELLKHKTFKGDRTSLSMLFTELNAFTVGELLAIYEHRVACEGFIYGINSFDQWGVELGKKLANNVREVFAKKDFEDLENKYKEQYNTATLGLMRFFIDNKKWD
jgi:glucose-6-phosphate isomerase